MALHSYGLYSYGLYSYCLYSHGLQSYGLHRYGLHTVMARVAVAPRQRRGPAPGPAELWPT